MLTKVSYSKEKNYGSSSYRCNIRRRNKRRIGSDWLLGNLVRSMQAPILEQLAGEVHEDELKILKMDVDENPNTAREFGIMSIPTLLFKKEGQVVKQVAGVHTKDQLKAIIAELS